MARPVHPPAASPALVRRHLRTGWLGLLIFLSLGIVLELLHGFKLDVYLDARNSARRLMWTLAHAHGTLFSLIHIAFACSLAAAAAPEGDSRLRLASRGLTGGLILLPLGFLLGGLWIHGGDPGAGIFLVPAGAASMFLGVAAALLALWKQGPVSPR